MSDHNEGGSSSSAKDIAASVGVGVVQTAMFIYDFLTFPIYYAAQRPWTLVDAGNRVRADIVARCVCVCVHTLQAVSFIYIRHPENETRDPLLTGYVLE